jgi:hypothetical protein
MSNWRAFSSRVMRPIKSATRASAGRAGFLYGGTASCAFNEKTPAGKTAARRIKRRNGKTFLRQAGWEDKGAMVGKLQFMYLNRIVH